MCGVTVSAPVDPFVHPVLFYRGDGEYLDGLLPFIQEGLDQGAPVAVAVPGGRLALLSGALGAAAREVRMIDMAEAGRNPGRIIPGVLRDFADRYPDRAVRIVGEPVWPSRTETEYPACAQHEALINLSFTGRDVTIVCPYDAARLDDGILKDAWATHPTVWESGEARTSEYFAPERVIADHNHRIRAPTGSPGYTVDTYADLAAARRFVAGHAGERGLSADRVSELRLMINELATNSLAHTSGGCTVRIWRAGADLVCEVRDGGHLTDPLAGRRPSPPDWIGGRGLLLVNQLADLVRTHTSPTGTTIHVHCRLS
ncbi:MAG TPA: sensor histidine kinase [Amycolatopsis sp.]|jgi:anti-sigma regulatory factor (Ser/Thr protein kinase)|nr:sensor histidine kinase [Amycolatopsis sp.]